ncbi:MAG: hypothetical protein ACRDD3_03730 [Azovibrio sp.]
MVFILELKTKIVFKQLLAFVFWFFVWSGTLFANLWAVAVFLKGPRVRGSSSPPVRWSRVCRSVVSAYAATEGAVINR